VTGTSATAKQIKLMTHGFQTITHNGVSVLEITFIITTSSKITVMIKFVKIFILMFLYYFLLI
jgi:hypothetical protein